MWELSQGSWKDFKPLSQLHPEGSCISATCLSCPASLFVPLLWDSERDGVVKIPRISSKYRHLFSSVAAASPGTASVRSKKKKKKKSYGAIFYSFISKWKCLKSLFKLEKSNKPNTRNSILATSGTAKKQRDWIHQLFIPMEEGKHRDFGLHFTRKAGWRLFLERWFWGVRSEVEWSTLGSHLCVTTSLEERGLSMGKGDSRILPHDMELFQIHPLPALW